MKNTTTFGFGVLLAVYCGVSAAQPWATFPDNNTPILSKPPLKIALADDTHIKTDAPVTADQDQVLPEYHGSASTYQEQIIAIENEYGVYDPQLTHQLMGLGLSFQNQGEHKIAISAFKRAAHISRINDGLYNLGQVPILTHLVQSYVANKDWKSANDKQYILYRLQQRNYGPGSPRLLEPLNKMVQWHLNAYQQGASVVHLLRAWELNKQAIAIIETNYGPNDMQLSENLFRQALTSYHLAVFQVANAQSSSFSGGRAGGMSVSTKEKEENIQMPAVSPYRDGKNALLRRVGLYKNNPESPVDHQADAIVQLGDWYFLFNKRESAIKTYREAQHVLVSNEETRDRVERVFGKPHALTFELSAGAESREEDKGKQQGYVDAEFNITPSGRARNIKIVDSNPPDVMDSLVHKSIKATRYRPRIVDGKPVLTKGVTYRHVFDF